MGGVSAIGQERPAPTRARTSELYSSRPGQCVFAGAEGVLQDLYSLGFWSFLWMATI